MSGKEAMVFVVRCGDDTRCAKVYKEATQRSFRQAVDYTENRKVKNTRQARAMAKGTRFGREAQEAAWQSAEVDALYRLAAAGVRVPTPYNFFEGVLLMELVADANGDAAPRLNDVEFTPEQALAHHATLLREVVRMLCAGVVHGDLSEFNILLGADGPVIIDLPQAVDAAGNNHAQRMLLRDVANLRDFFGRFAPGLLQSRFGDEIWDLYRRGVLQPRQRAERPLHAHRGPRRPGQRDARDRRRARRRGGAAPAAAGGALTGPHAGAAHGPRRAAGQRAAHASGFPSATLLALAVARTRERGRQRAEPGRQRGEHVLERRNAEQAAGGVADDQAAQPMPAEQGHGVEHIDIHAGGDEFDGHHVAHREQRRVEFFGHHGEHQVTVRHDAHRTAAVGLRVDDDQRAHMMFAHQLRRARGGRVQRGGHHDGCRDRTQSRSHVQRSFYGMVGRMPGASKLTSTCSRPTSCMLCAVLAAALRNRNLLRGCPARATQRTRVELRGRNGITVRIGRP